MYASVCSERSPGGRGTRIAFARRSTLLVGIALMSIGACAADNE